MCVFYCLVNFFFVLCRNDSLSLPLVLLSVVTAKSAKHAAERAISLYAALLLLYMYVRCCRWDGSVCLVGLGGVVGGSQSLAVTSSVEESLALLTTVPTGRTMFIKGTV